MTNGTEDDTFKVLSRPSFDEMRNIHHAWYYDGTTNKNTSLRIPFMRKHGWTWLEFMLEATKRGVGDRL